MLIIVLVVKKKRSAALGIVATGSIPFIAEQRRYVDLLLPKGSSFGGTLFPIAVRRLIPQIGLDRICSRSSPLIEEVTS